jgi:hypothetical protein
VSRVAISEAWAVEECEERVSLWWLLRVVRVRESSVCFCQDIPNDR